MTSKVALVTGCSSGMGAAVAVQLAERGHKVYASMRNLEKRAALDARAKAAGVSLEVVRLDVTENDTILGVVADIVARDGRIDLLVNNAGVGSFQALEHASEDDVDWVIDTNFKGMLRTMRAVLPHMRKARSGQVINVTSIAGLIGVPFNDVYSGAKFGVEGVTEALATYMTPAFGIRFTCVEPGGIESELVGTALAKAHATMPDDEYRILFNAMFQGADRPEARAAFQTADEVAAVVVGVSEHPDPPLRIRTGPWAEGFTQFKTSGDPEGRLSPTLMGRMFPRL